MKNIVKLLGIIALVAIIGFSMTSCAAGGTLVVKNTSSTTYDVKVAAGSLPDSYFELAGGASKTFSYDTDIGVDVGFKLPDRSVYTRKDNVNVSGGETVTVNIP